MKALIFIILISISSCNETKKTTEIESTENTQTEFKLVESDFVILPFNNDWHWIFKDVQPTKLTQSELIEIESILKIAVKENNERQKVNLKKHNEEYPKNKWSETGFELKLNGKKRQYVPVINQNGEKEIWINFFCNNWESDSWKTDLMIVHDGGNCYFNLKVNLTNKAYSELMINGYA
ncbi:hypothetical protein [Galbibacter orientalis]|uniref:hypothetical protein n=1 Tax=Galbibacter orientalis TaxID=453852 RepID=UPI003080AEDA